MAYLDYTGLQRYDGKIKNEIDARIDANIDADLDTEGKAADAKAVGDYGLSVVNGKLCQTYTEE